VLLRLPCYVSRLSHPSVPTRRASDLRCVAHAGIAKLDAIEHIARRAFPLATDQDAAVGTLRGGADEARRSLSGRNGRNHSRRKRSEEHTSELQSRVDLVCRLLLEKKK